MALERTVHALGAMALTGALILAAAPAASADQTRRDQWALDALQAESVWKISKGKGVTVAVIDTGVNAEHQDLKGNVLKGKDFVDGDDDTSPADSDSSLSTDHGTEMASIIAGHGHGADAADGVMGLAPEAKILPIRWGGGSLADEIRYAVDHGAAIISMSLSTSQGFTEDRDAVNYALSHNVLLVTASGNEGKPDHIDFPGKFPGVLTVGGVSKSGTIWSGSNYGPEVLLTAPATEIVSAGWPGNTLRIGTGTSTSTAFTSAAAALIKSKFPNLTPGQIANRLVKSATLPESAKGISLPDEKYGYGIINPLMALTKNIPAGSKYGPLKISVPEGSSATPSSGASDTGATKNEKEDQKQMLFFVILGVVALLVVSLIVLLIVKLSRRNKNNNGGPGGQAPYQPYGQQQFPPQQNPYQQPPTPPHSQWPPQQ
ncbi:S8 family serine peptidase [Streptomyces canus]|uniref:S8 family serine peptidase n=1 Tax=Streptomyces canus TaxID=58343 RepID=UPI00225658BE|nr:S8 family serine peptidase [Streptomyces canus]